MSFLYSPYSTGTVSISNGSDDLVGVGTAWASLPIVPGDLFAVQGLIVPIATVTDEENIILEYNWPGTTISGGSYLILKNSPERYDPAITQAKARDFLARLDDMTPIYRVAEGEEPDPGIGNDGDVAMRFEPGEWTSWVKETGAWVEQVPPLAVPVVDTKLFGAVADGSTDDSAAVQDFFDYLAANGGEGFISAGEHALETAISVSASTTPFKVRGYGRHTSILKRAASIGTPLAIASSADIDLEDFGIDGGYSDFASNANHGISVGNSDRIRCRRLHVTNVLNTMILMSGDVADAHEENIIEDCTGDGVSGTGNNGFSVNRLKNSGIRGCNVKDAAGSPGYGVQVKDAGSGCFVEMNHVAGCAAGVAFGQQSGAGADLARVIGNTCRGNVDKQFVFGYATRAIIAGNLADCEGIADCDAFDFSTDCVGNAGRGNIVRNVASDGWAVRFNAGATDNFFGIEVMSSVPATAIAFNGSALRNRVEIGNLVGTENPTTAELIDGNAATAAANGNRVYLAGRGDQFERYDVASASTASIANSPSDYVRITGTTTITSFGTGWNGCRRIILFQSALTLTHSSSLVLPGSENIAIGANDTCIAVCQGGTTWRVLSFMRASGLPATAKTALLGAGSVAAHTGTTAETTLATIAVPAGWMGPNGRVRIMMLCSYTNSGNNKTVRVKLGGTNFLATSLTTTASMQTMVVIRNINNQAVQQSWVNSVNTITTSGNAINSGTIDTSAAQNVTITVELADSGESFTLVDYMVELLTV